MADIISINATGKVQSYVPFGGAKVDLGSDAIVPSPEFPLLQYATGLPAQRPKLDASGQQAVDEETGETLWDNLYYAGFFTACGKDKAVDEAMQACGMPWIDIHHGSGDVARHWMIERPTLFLMALGVPGNANSNGSMGMAYTWRQKRNSTKSETVLYAQVVIRQLLPHFDKPFVFTVKSTQTGDALIAMRKQYKVLSQAREELRRNGHDISLPLWAYSTTFGASKKQELRGKEGASKTIFPLIAGIPDNVTPEYLQRQEVPTEYIAHFKKLAEKSAEWAQGLTQRLVAGVEPQDPWKASDSVVEAPF